MSLSSRPSTKCNSTSESIVNISSKCFSGYRLRVSMEISSHCCVNFLKLATRSNCWFASAPPCASRIIFNLIKMALRHKLNAKLDGLFTFFTSSVVFFYVRISSPCAFSRRDKRRQFLHNNDFFSLRRKRFGGSGAMRWWEPFARPLPELCEKMTRIFAWEILPLRAIVAHFFSPPTSHENVLD